MQYLTQRPTGRGPAVRGLLLAAAALAVAAACDRRDELPTDPSTATLVRPQATVEGATVTILPLSGVAINESGQVAGNLAVAGDVHAALWTASGGVQDLGTLGGSTSFAFAINDAGQVVGYSYTAGNAARHAFLWTPGRGMEDLGTLGGSPSFARGINDKGQVVGDSYTGTARHAFLWTPGQGMQDLGALGGDLTQSIAHDINNAGQVVGESFYVGATEMGSHAFLWTASGGMQHLGSFGGGMNGSVAYAINEAGQVVGRSWTALGPYHAFLWAPGAGMQDLGTLVTTGMNSVAFSINEAGQVVGASNTLGDVANHGFLWSAADGMEDLYPSTGMRGTNDINDRQQIIGGDRLATLPNLPANRTPIANVGGPYSGAEGSAVMLAFSGTDADGDGLTYTWDLGDGTVGSGVTPPASHAYADDGSFSVRLTVSDGRGGSDTQTTTATIANVAPTIPADGLTGPATLIQLVAGTAGAPITVAFADPAGTNDTYAAEIQCGNGTMLTPNGNTSPHQGICRYTSAGVYTVRATVADEDGGTSAPAFFRYVIVYDPDGAFTTGSGFFAVPGKGKGKAHFTFHVKYIPGRPAAPNGAAKFWIPGAPVDFAATVIEALIASGDRVQFWGTGTLNGAAARFRVTAEDSPLTGGGGADAVRIELWRAGSLVVDTQPGDPQDAPVTTVIHGGNIEIHERARRN